MEHGLSMDEFLIKTGDFHDYVSLSEGRYSPRTVDYAD